MRGVGDLFQDGSHGDEPVAGLGECIVKGELTGLPRAFRQFKWKETFFFHFIVGHLICLGLSGLRRLVGLQVETSRGN